MCLLFFAEARIEKIIPRKGNATVRFQYCTTERRLSISFRVYFSYSRWPCRAAANGRIGSKSSFAQTKLKYVQSLQWCASVHCFIVCMSQLHSSSLEAIVESVVILLFPFITSTLNDPKEKGGKLHYDFSLIRIQLPNTKRLAHMTKNHI